MATPRYEELLKGATTWRDSHKGVTFTLLHHGYCRGDDYEGARHNPGTWCYYLIIPEQMYPHRWPDFACVRSESGYEHPGPAWESVEFDSEITWSSSEPYYDRKEKRQYDASKVGCDYAHLWHMERGYPDTYESVRGDAMRTVESFLRAHPDRRLSSDYSHRWGTPDQFYTAVNGRLVHVDDEIPDEWDGWKRPSAPKGGA